jgi:hypothetical protein
MKLGDLAKKPQLIKVSMDDEFIVKAYGEPVDFYMYDRQDLPTYIKLSKVESDNDELPKLIRQLVLDEKGKPAMGADKVLDVEIMIKVIETVVKNLGNLKNLTSAT